MTENKRFKIKPSVTYNNKYVIHDSEKEYTFPVLDSTLNYMFCKALNELSDENEQLKKELKRCKCWLNSNKNDYQLTLAFIKSKGYSLKDVLEYEKELEE